MATGLQSTGFKHGCTLYRASVVKSKIEGTHGDRWDSVEVRLTSALRPEQ